MKIAFSIDGGAIAKQRPRMTRSGIAYTPAKTRAYEAHGRLCAQQAMGDEPPIEGPCRMTVRVIKPIPASWPKWKRQMAANGCGSVTKPDIDNHLKAALDICNGIVFRDDCQVTHVTASKAYGDKPRMEIEVERIEA